MRRGIAELPGIDLICRRGRDDLDRLPGKYLPDKGTYIEAGALDGFSFGNTDYLDRVKGWNELLVEPNPPQFHGCLKFRRRAHVVQCDLVPFNYLSPTVKITYGADLTWTEGAYVGDEERQRRSLLKRYGLSGETIEVPARTIQSLIDEYSLTADFLSLDVEDFENSVLQGLDRDQSAPTFLLVECHTPDRIAEVKQTLGDYYHTEKKLTRHDYLLIRK